MKRLTTIIITIIFLAGCTAKNLFDENMPYSDPGRMAASSYCKKHSDKADYNECMDREFLCAAEVIVAMGITVDSTKKELVKANRKSTKILKKGGLWEKWVRRDCSYCEIVLLFQDEWWDE